MMLSLPHCLQVGMVLDLTNSNRYYRFEEEVPDAEQRQIAYVKVSQHKRCLERRGRQQR